MWRTLAHILHGHNHRSRVALCPSKIEAPMSAASEGKMPLPGPLDRPFYFIIVLWGRTFRNYFLECCLASLLSPGNIPALNTSTRSKFLIATRPDDWAALRDAAN